MIKLLYSLLIAASIVGFIGVAVYAFYQPPKYPDYSNYSYSQTSDPEYVDQEYDKATDAYDKKMRDYNHNVTYFLIPASVALVAAGTYLYRRIDVIGEGLALGGLATLIYAIITSAMGDSKPLLVITAGLLVAGSLVIAWTRFGRARN